MFRMPSFRVFFVARGMSTAFEHCTGPAVAAQAVTNKPRFADRLLFAPADNAHPCRPAKPTHMPLARYVHTCPAVAAPTAAPAAASDPYMTRGCTASIAPRSDPCVWPSLEEAASGGPLSVQQLEGYDRDGFIVLPGLLSPDEVSAGKTAADDLYTSLGDTGLDRVTGDVNFATEADSAKLRSAFAVHKEAVSPGLSALCHAEQVVAVAKQILGERVYIHQSRINWQAPFEGKGFYWHSDFETWHAEDGMPVPRALSCILMLADNSATNGALMVMPGSHTHYCSCAGETPDKNWETSLKFQQRYGTPSHEQLTELAEKCGVQHVTGTAGTAVFFDSNLMHGSHTNITPFGRTNLFQVFNAASNKLVEPYHAPTVRPEHIATRDGGELL